MTEDANNITKILLEVHIVNEAIGYFDFSTKEVEKILANNGFVEEYGDQCDIEEWKSLLLIYSIALKALKKYRTEITGISEEDYEEME